MVDSDGTAAYISLSPSSPYGFIRGFLKPNPKEEPGLFLGPRVSFADSITADVQRSILSGRPPKVLIYGFFGLGKTHLASYMMSKLDSLIRGVYLETPPSHRRTRFTDLHQVMMRELGRDFASTLLSKAVSVNKSVSDLAKDLGINEDLASAIASGLPANKLLLWRYLSGEKIKPNEVEVLQTVKQQINEDEAASILSAIAKLVRRNLNKQLTFFIDEVENTSPLIGDNLRMFKEGMRGLVDYNNAAGVILISSARELRQVRVVDDEPIKRRIGLQNLRFFEEYSEEELTELLRDIIQMTRDPKFDPGPIVASLKTKGEDLDRETYPFTKQALKAVVQTVTRLRKDGLIDSRRPSEALDMLDTAIAIGIEKKAPYISLEICKEAISRLPPPKEAETPQ